VAEIEPAKHFFLNEEAEQSGRSWTFPIHFTWTVPLLFYLFPYFRPRKLSVPFLSLFFFFFKKIQKHKSGASDSAPKWFKTFNAQFWAKIKNCSGWSRDNQDILVDEHKTDLARMAGTRSVRL